MVHHKHDHVKTDSNGLTVGMTNVKNQISKQRVGIYKTELTKEEESDILKISGIY